jgi:hypothetical protein
VKVKAKVKEDTKATTRCIPVDQEKGKGKLVRLGDIAEVRFGIKTGANEFFYLDQEKIREWGIEEEFLKPFLFSLKEVQKYEIEAEALKRKGQSRIERSGLRRENVTPTK